MGFYVKIYDNETAAMDISRCTEVLTDISNNKLYVNIRRTTGSTSRIAIEENGACVEVYNTLTDKLINRYAFEEYYSSK